MARNKKISPQDMDASASPGTVMRRSANWTDRMKQPGSTFQMERTIQTGLNYQLPANEIGSDYPDQWQETDDNDYNEAGTIPPDWDGAFDFKHQILKGPAQIHAVGLNNEPRAGIRRSRFPSEWYNMQLLSRDGDPTPTVVPSRVPGMRAVEWAYRTGLEKLRFVFSRQGMGEKLIFADNTHGTVYRFGVHVPAGDVVSVEDSSRLVITRGTVPIWKSAPVRAFDRADDPTSLESQFLPVTLQMGQTTGGGIQTIEIVCGDWSSAVYPVEVG